MRQATGCHRCGSRSTGRRAAQRDAALRDLGKRSCEALLPAALGRSSPNQHRAHTSTSRGGTMWEGGAAARNSERGADVVSEHRHVTSRAQFSAHRREARAESEAPRRGRPAIRSRTGRPGGHRAGGRRGSGGGGGRIEEAHRGGCTGWALLASHRILSWRSARLSRGGETSGFARRQPAVGRREELGRSHPKTYSGGDTGVQASRAGSAEQRQGS